MKRIPGREAQQIIEQADSSLLDVIDHVLNQGVVITGDVILGLADVDLIYLGLSVVLCPVDRLSPPEPEK
jgi:hypothetical protein